MSIKPVGGWDEPTDRVNSSQGDRLSSQPHVRRSYLTCKTCDVGTLSSKSTFRLSGPAVAIGFILLIPSILGIVGCALMLIGVISIPSELTHKSEPTAYQSEFDSSFLKSCTASAKSTFDDRGLETSDEFIGQVCDCSLAEFKTSGSQAIAARICIERANNGTLGSSKIDRSSATSSNVDSRRGEHRIAPASRLLGSVWFIALGVAFFVGGLLGWLLIMRKRILQCDTCGAVVNAS